MSTITQIRSFNRFYTNFLGLLNRHILDSTLSLSESRILYELAQQESIPASQLVSTLQMDKGYLSRILRRFEKEGYIQKITSAHDKRVQNICLSSKGKSLFKYLNTQSERQIDNYTRHLTETEKEHLAKLLAEAEDLLIGSQPASPNTLADISIRTHLVAGDLGFVIRSHGELYQQEYGFGTAFEQYVAKGLVEFSDQYDPDRNRVWVCEHQGKRIGFLLLMDRGEAAQLRYFFIDNSYRGVGLGKKLMQLYIDFLKEKGYRSSYLWTTHELTAAASLYRRHGFQLVEEKPSTDFGKALIEQKYELRL
uniref:Helix-turn-helix domain-containing GNAT family N-acetyltransferase n=1 Tax=Roseihalotalea indica TaxID=2867963 RepID=A0AA49JC13_9BACT|nr:helix-turn-helix domain-containing GNAT family N-acetyltransferase [Tunicatimonas sp. TK19036]